MEKLNFNVINFAYKCKKVGTTFETIPTICISSTIEGKTQVGWAFVVGQKTQKCVHANNVLPRKSPHHVLNFVEMIMRSLC